MSTQTQTQIPLLLVFNCAYITQSHITEFCQMSGNKKAHTARWAEGWEICVPKPKANCRNILAIAFTWGGQMSLLECESSSTANTTASFDEVHGTSAEMAKDTAFIWHFCLSPFLETPPFLAEVGRQEAPLCPDAAVHRLAFQVGPKASKPGCDG